MHPVIDLNKEDTSCKTEFQIFILSILTAASEVGFKNKGMHEDFSADNI